MKNTSKKGKTQEPPKKKASAPKPTSAPKPNFASPRDSVQNARDISQRLRLYKAFRTPISSDSTREKEDLDLLEKFLDKRGFGGPNNKFSTRDKDEIVKRALSPAGAYRDEQDPATNYKKGGKMPTTYAKGGKTPLPGMKKPKSSSCK